MRVNPRVLLALALIFFATVAARAQVDKVAARANRPLWGSCGATIKAALERQAGVAQVVIDQQSNVVFVAYQPNTHFEAAVFRDAALEADAAFLLIQIAARGRIIEEGSDHFLLAGEDRFVLIEPPEASKPIPEVSDRELLVIGTLDDSVTPNRLKIVQSTPMDPEAEAESQ